MLLTGLRPHPRSLLTRRAYSRSSPALRPSKCGRVENVRAGRKLLPKSWPNGARVAVCISFDVDNEALWRTNPLPVPLSQGEYGAKEALPRILNLLDRYHVPASFYIPVLSAVLHPDMIPQIMTRPPRDRRARLGARGVLGNR